ncbi:MAG: Glycosyl transferase group 1 [candidate division WWE3 bacterium GW2011_GWF2_41_45]|uniref:Glycosyl transferase family 1 domain-containing protein n=3 Tax=Katanobacteria TaxID=422282 RepID=A0A1F4W3H6_UNCKA|nr:MAG: Glycosyl transferase group 1 [candidate division WWE3 bacterium GW2011_GWC2_41_23]KKS10778.1 MAG: Glycosyl transferase group 1 [candidate division WWE3 bacterium GW2011_GWF2_41_45]KKS12454.1 MAG: Glycosyl transferase group 1 [candidate division WWE3 bacterium GW2011_GWF1_41_53]KKS20167.1 MAG: Glycosyl transferase group 1 [candidate division WWE3 bacterium GW2011_GWE1_41_72]KKS28395.1 MAG: Glycosyl transferase group 1 [candidate division WWE3 bacterium GW2011_GWC1_42_102]KKS28715.1 MAG:
MVQPGSTKKRLLVFVPEFPVLTETFIERELAKIAERGNLDLLIMSLLKGSGEFSPVLKPLVRYRRLSLPDVLFSLRYFFTSGTNISKALDTLNSCHMPKIRQYYTLLKGMGYAQIFSPFKPNFIIAHFMSESSTIVMVAALVLGVPYAISAHAKDVTVNPHCMKEKSENAAFVLICNKHAHESCVGAVGSDYSHKILLKYHGLDTSKFGRSEHTAKIPLILNIGRLEEKKGQKYLLEAAKILHDDGVEFKMLIIGPGSLYGELSEQIGALGLSEQIEILGGGTGLPFSETQRYYSESDVFVFSGINTEEGDADGIANVLLEAAASRLPIVATDSGSTKEFLENGVSGLVVPQRNPVALAESLKSILNNKELAGRLAEEAYGKVTAEFNIEVNVAHMEDLIIKESI